MAFGYMYPAFDKIEVHLVFMANKIELMIGLLKCLQFS